MTVNTKQSDRRTVSYATLDDLAADLDKIEVAQKASIVELRGEINRIKGGERFAHPSPLFGKMTHEQWTRLQLGHASLHLSFLQS